ncbi:hypothetical protein [Helicobacter cappadocius]|uniref:Uncharacterized protein n=1 Tax=Helicobacter cappadocius TaxID=3063998 RepID=A0AA90TEQ8_9HELI|nr:MULTISPECIES: hypothetical protein [unclassified Helicobacter]MDO7252807.1 hypothetical protein [Helicobacter sp. faydin-H75]MDP2538850.1 hypothetical protein [Helicobacter sp. faydin-H76]
MKFKYYIMFAVLFIIATAIYIYSLNSGSYTLSASHQGESLNLPIAIWVAIIVLVFFVISLIFFLGEWIRGLLTKYYNNRDFEKIIHQIIEQNTRKNPPKETYKNHHFDLLSKILARFDLKANLNSQNSTYSKIDKLFEAYKQIDKGIEQDIKKYDLSEDNEFFIKNTQNKISKDTKFALDVLKGTLSTDLKKYAFIAIVQNSSDKEIQKALELSRSFLDKEMLRELFVAYSQNRATFEIDNITKLCKSVQYAEINYLRLAKESKPFLSPDMWLKIFGKLANNDEKAEKAYLYALIDLEMIEQAKERLSTHNKDDFLIINAYLELKKMGRNYPVNLFFGIQ